MLKLTKFKVAALLLKSVRLTAALREPPERGKQEERRPP
jgi:hypothetical protein